MANVVIEHTDTDKIDYMIDVEWFVDDKHILVEDFEVRVYFDGDWRPYGVMSAGDSKRWYDFCVEWIAERYEDLTAREYEPDDHI